MEVNRAPYETLLRVPGIGVKSARKICAARRMGTLRFADLKKLNVVLKRAQYFITCAGKMAEGLRITEDTVLRAMVSQAGLERLPGGPEQLSLFSTPGTPNLPPPEALPQEVRRHVG